MAFILDFDEKAEIEFQEAFDWYEEQQLGLGKRFEAALERSFAHIANAPLAYPLKKLTNRECVVKDFPFSVVFKVYPSQNVVYIVSIFHTSRRPSKKYRSL